MALVHTSYTECAHALIELTLQMSVRAGHPSQETPAIQQVAPVKENLQSLLLTNLLRLQKLDFSLGKETDATF